MFDSMSTNKKDLKFDSAKLDGMQEPLTVRVEKIRGSGNGLQRTPIDLPSRDGEPPGVGWDKDSIRRLESWLAREWSGGGFYNVTVTDARGITMEWQFIFDTREFPELTPPTMVNASTPPQNSQAPKQQPAMTSMPNGGIWPPPGFSFNPTIAAQPFGHMGNQNPMASQPFFIPQFMPQIVPQIVQQAQQPAPPPAQPPQHFPTWAPPPPTTQTPSPRASMMQEDFARRRLRNEDDDHEKKALEQRTRELEAKINESEREKIEQRYRAELEKAQTDAKVQMESLRLQQQGNLETLKDELRRMSEAKATAPNPDLEAIRKEREQLERQREQDELNKRFEDQRRMIQDSQKAMFDALQTIAKSMETRAQQPIGPDPQLQAMAENQRRLEEELRRERERAERDRERAELDRREREREERLRLELQRRDDETKRIAEEAKRREDLLQQQMIQQMAEIRNSANKGPDPMFLALQEMNRTQLDSMKDLMRIQQDNSNKMSSFMLTPRDMLAIQKDSSSGIEDLKRNVVDVYRDVFDLQREVMSQAAQLSPQGESPTARIMEEALKRVSGLADRYLQGRRDEVVSAAKVQESAMQVEHAKNAMRLQAEQAFRQRQMELAALAQQEAQAAAQGLNGLNGAGNQAQVPFQTVAPTPQVVSGPSAQAEAPSEAMPSPKGAPKKKKKVEAAPARTIDEGVNVDPKTGQTIAKVIPLRRLGYTDEEWFGPALDHVKELRAGVAEFMKSLEEKKIDPKTGQPYGTDPMQCVDFLVRAVNYIVGRNLPVRAFQDLFLQGQFADMMDILLPEAPQQYRDDCTMLLIEVKRENDKRMAGGVDQPTVEGPEIEANSVSYDDGEEEDE
jgi:hypothetical protein